MRKFKLTNNEKKIEDNLLKGDYVDVEKKDFADIANAISLRKKDAVLNIRVNSKDLASIKQKAQSMGIKYQTFLSEIIHKIAQVR